ncbi:MAG TPA: SLOG family protein [Dehalococcoidia bacterium]|nr:SLOG family protein [Dehalococcoidia bacterium]
MNTQPLRVLVCGSRSYTSKATIGLRLAELPAGSEIIHGDARGADTIADGFAREFGLNVTRYPANWARHGHRAGLIRNIEMLDTKPDLVLAFWDGVSRGTRHTITEAENRGIPVETHGSPVGVA